MPTKRPHTTSTLARNINFLMGKYGYSEKEVARRAGISSKTVNNIRNATHSTTIENTDLVARVFGLNGWQLIMPNLPHDLLESAAISSIIDHYAASDDSGREAIQRLAEREALYNKR